MYKEETVFILGAGASWHYNYPTGEDLVYSVIGKAKDIVSFIDRYPDLPKIWSAHTPEYIRSKFKNIPHSTSRSDRETIDLALKEVKEECQKIAKALRHVKPIVIDNFLAQNSSLAPIGKFLISWVILECERQYYGREDGDERKHNRNRVIQLQSSPDKRIQKEAANADLEKFKDDWCRFILHRLAQKPEEILNNKVSFITFNYDVSLERSIYTGLKYIERFSNENAIDSFMNSDRFLHMYGKLHDNYKKETLTLDSLGDFPPRELLGKHLEFWKSYWDKIYECSQNIFTIEDCENDGGEKNKCEETQKIAQEKIQKAKYIYILGYGFDERNSERLRLSESLRDQTESALAKKVYFTNFGDRNIINKKASKIFLDRPEIFLFPTYIQSPRTDPRTKSSYFEKSTKDVYEALEFDFDFLMLDTDIT